MSTLETTESIKVERSALATYRYIAERTGVSLTQLISDTLRSCAKMYLVGANAAIDSLAKESKKP